MASNSDASDLSIGVFSNNIEDNVASFGGSTSSRPTDRPRQTEVPERPQIRKVYVGNLNPRTSSRDLRNFFGSFGQVQNAHFAKNRSGIRPNYGFVTYFEPEDAWTAINVGQSGNIQLHGRRLVVNEADLKYQPRQLPNGKILWNCWLARPSLSSAPIEPEVEIDESKCMLHLLDDDCLRLIFSLLPKKDLIKSERVCKRWQAVCRDMWLSTKVLSFSDLGMKRSILTMHIVRQLLDRCGPSLVTIDLSYKPSELHASVLSIVADFCPNLAGLNLSTLPLTMAGLKAIGQSCPQLRRIILDQCNSVNDRELQKFFHLCKNLESVILSQNNSVTGRCLEGLNKEKIQDLSLNNCSNLQSEIVNNCVASFSKLRSLNIDSCVNLTCKDVTFMFQALPQLKSLSMRQYFPHVSHLAFKDIGYLKELVSLNIGQNNSITDDVLKSIAKGCKKLKNLNITGCSIHSDRTVGDFGIAAIAKLPLLTNLKMSYMALATDSALISLAENASRLQTLECRGCPTFHDFGCSRVVTLCNELRLFDFSGCDEVSNDTVNAAIAAIKLRTNNVPLKLVVGGTFVDEDIKVDIGLLNVDTSNLCVSHLRPDFVDNHYFLSESDDDDFEDMYDVDFDVVGSPAMFFGDDLGEYYGYLAFMEGQDFSNSDFDDDDDDDDDD